VETDCNVPTGQADLGHVRRKAVKRKTVSILLVLFGLLLGANAAEEEHAEIHFDPKWTLKELAQENGLTPGELKETLHLPKEVRGNTPVQELGITKEQLTRALSGQRSTSLLAQMAAFQGLIACVLVLSIFLLVKNRMSGSLKLLLLFGVTLGLGFGFGKSFNPMTGLVKVFKCVTGLEGNLDIRTGALILFTLGVIVGTKAVCGWGCPYGTLQEFLHRFPLRKRL
jgi:hypothetical protein